ncbi:MAG: hypothetical protein GY842_15790 [bacterium]|nr:hypothetical protein [bacterium]
MGDWYLIACLAATAMGVLVFLRIVTTEVHAVDAEAEILRHRERAKRQRPTDDEVTLERAG